jgi:hypothetical protein
MQWPRGIEVDGYNSDEYVLQVHKNVYGGKAAGRTWNKHLVKKLEFVGFKQSAHDHCVFYKGTAMYTLYTDDSILAGPDKAELLDIIQQMKDANLDLTVEGDLSDFLGVNIDKQSDGTLLLTQSR